jgi:ABC-type lipoprotein release transport system permease subunit
MRGSAWIAWRELINRPWSFLLALVTISVAVAVCAATELVHRAREVAVSAQVDAMGPGLRLIPPGRTSRDLVRFELGTALFLESMIEEIQRAEAGSVRVVEARLLLKRPVGGIETPLIGVDPNTMVAPVAGLRGLANREVVLGNELARRLGKQVGDSVVFAGGDFTVKSILDSTASVEDMAMLLTLEDLRAGTGLAAVVNEIRLYPLPGFAAEKIAQNIQLSHPKLAIILPDNDDATRTEVDQSLSGLRWIIYSVTAMVAAFCVLVWSNLNASERRVEMATLVALGGSAWTVFATLALRVCIIAVGGALLGNALAVGIALMQDFEAAKSIVWSPDYLILWPTASVLIAVLGAIPVTLLSAFREHVRELQT